MKKLLIYFFFNIFLFTFIKADVMSINILKNRLKQIDNIYACFVQKIITPDGNVKEISQGELWMKQPNLFHCHIFKPRENFLISDGKTIWFYVPIIKQVIAYNLKTSLLNNMFFKLLFNYNIPEWHNYNIIQKKDWFFLTPIRVDNVTNFKEYRIKINQYGIIDQFSIIESRGQCINYYLFNQCIKPIDISKFQFVMSSDIQLDDQRY